MSKQTETVLDAIDAMLKEYGIELQTPQKTENFKEKPPKDNSFFWKNLFGRKNS